jgi:hypothetical protein
MQQTDLIQLCVLTVVRYIQEESVLVGRNSRTTRVLASLRSVSVDTRRRKTMAILLRISVASEDLG